MKRLTIAFAAASLLVASVASADVQVAIQNGRVSIKAKDVTVRQIMQEWARVGQTRVVNVERIAGAPITLELTNVTEAQALEVLLRSVSGYIAAPRTVAAANNLSQYDRIVVMPGTAAPRQALSTAPVPAYQAPPPQPVVDDDPDDAPAGARPPIFGQFPQPQVTNPQNQVLPPGFQPPPGYVPPNGGVPPGAVGGQPVQQPPSNTFGAPSGGVGGVAVPGMMVPAPQQQPGQPGSVQPVPPNRGRGGQ